MSGLLTAAKKKLPFAGRLYRALESIVRTRASHSYVAKLVRQGQPIFVEVGSGDKHGTNGWVTVDMTRGCDLYWDLRNGLPFPDASVAKIYSSHFMEHLSYAESQEFLSECLRALKPGGSFSVCVPNARLYLEAYVKRQPLDPNLWLAYKPAVNNTTLIDYANYVGYMAGHHKYMFDEENLIHILRAKGFKNVSLREFQPGLDLEDRHFESIYAQGEK